MPFLRPLAALAAFAALIAYATIMLRGPQGLNALQEKRHEVRLLQEENANLAREIEQKKARVQKLASDQGTQELEIRKRLKMQHPGYTDYVLPDAKAPRANAPGDPNPARTLNREHP